MPLGRTTRAAAVRIGPGVLEAEGAEDGQAGLGDRALRTAGPAGGLGRDQSEVGADAAQKNTGASANVGTAVQAAPDRQPTSTCERGPGPQTRHLHTVMPSRRR